MAGEFREEPLLELCSYINRGAAPSYVNKGGLLVLNQKCVRSQRVDFSGARRTDQERKPVADERMLRPLDILVNSTGVGTLGRVAQVRKLPEPATVDSHMTILRPDLEAVEPLYLGMAVRCFESDIEALGEGSTGQTELSRARLGAIKIPIPSRPEQTAIARILIAFDDKIELNRRMSEALEAIARALFKSWFIDFDPVRAKMEGRWRKGESLPGLPASLYDFFSDRLIDSELGKIPEGWGSLLLNNVLAELVSGSRPKGGALREGVPSIGAENVLGLGNYDFSKEKFIPQDFYEELKRKGAAVRPGDVLLYKDGAQIGRKTYLDRGFPHAECAINEHVFIVRANRAQEQRYLFFWLDQDWMTQEIVSLNSNSAQPGINQQGVRGLPYLMAPKPIVEAFDFLCLPITDRLFSCCIENRTLTGLRDALLPKLISGNIKIKNPDRFAEIS